MQEILGFDVGAAESYEFWLEFLRNLVARGAGRSELAAVPGALHAESVLASAQACPGRGDG